jgi:uncharacterized protein (DUF1499 family)
MVFVAYVRFAPSDPDRWHVDPSIASDPGRGGVLRKITSDLAAFDAIIRTGPRVRVLTGAVAEGHITYVTRSRVFGFPDYITVKQIGPELIILSRLRFGRSDMGVNAARLNNWLEPLDTIKN